MGLTLVPSTITAACAHIAQHHRHNKPPQGALFALAVADATGRIVGVATVGRPVARKRADGVTAEVTRCCVEEGHKGACSMLYGAAWRAAKALGWQRLLTYTLASESGASLRGAGWVREAELPPNRPEKWQSRAGREAQAVVGEAKVLWRIGLPLNAKAPQGGGPAGPIAAGLLDGQARGAVSIAASRAECRAPGKVATAVLCRCDPFARVSLNLKGSAHGGYGGPNPSQSEARQGFRSGERREGISEPSKVRTYREV